MTHVSGEITSAARGPGTWLRDEWRDIIVAAISLSLIGTTCYLFLSGNDTPDALTGMDGAVITYFFMRNGTWVGGPPRPQAVDVTVRRPPVETATIEA